MNIKLNDKGFVSIDLSKKNKKYRIYAKVKSKFINYEVYSKIGYDDLISIIEGIESMMFSRYRCVNRIELERITLKFIDFDTSIKLSIKLDNNQEYSIVLTREDVLNLYNYITKYVNTFSKMNMMNFNKKYTYVEVRYIDVYCSRRYSYISDDKNIKVGDIVYVDRAGNKCLAVVETKNEYYYEQAPYPVLETKRVIKIVTRANQYKG